MEVHSSHRVGILLRDLDPSLVELLMKLLEVPTFPSGLPLVRPWVEGLNGT